MGTLLVTVLDATLFSQAPGRSPRTRSGLHVSPWADARSGDAGLEFGARF
jgi:hypothetical protein